MENKGLLASKKRFLPQLNPPKYLSHHHYNVLWAQAQAHLRIALRDERTRGELSGTDRQMFGILSQVFHQYLTIYKKMEEAYDQICHPQKRILMRKLLDLIIVRLLEIRQVLVSTEKSEFLYFDELAYVQKIPPAQLEVPIPKYCRHDPTPEMTTRNNWYLAIQQRKDKVTVQRLELERQIKARIDSEVCGWKGGEGEESGRESQERVICIQRMERGRQGRARFLIAKYIFDEEKRNRTRKARQGQKLMDQHTAILIIQKVVRGFLCRRWVSREREDELELLGLKWPVERGGGTVRGEMRRRLEQGKGILEGAKEQRRIVRKRNQKLFEESESGILSRIRLFEGPEMAEQIKSQFRNWILEVKETTGKLPDLPKTDLPRDIGQKGDKRVGQGPEAVERGKKRGEKESEKGRKKKGGGGGLEVEVPKLTLPLYFSEMMKLNLEYNAMWRGGGVSWNPLERHEEALIFAEKRGIVGGEIWGQVDSALRSELNLLRQALDRKKAKGKKGKQGKKGKKSKKGGKKGKKKKKGKDLTPDRTMESLFEELMENGIVRRYEEVRWDELLGSCSLVNGELQSFYDTFRKGGSTGTEGNPAPSFGDVKRALKDIAILPMSSKAVHEKAPLTKSLLICGPEGSGKKSLLNAICTELDATLFDLSASTIAGKYGGKGGMNMLMHLISKVGRAVPPLVILITSCEKTYMKKVPKTDKTEPKRLKKQLGKLVKSINPGDQILLVGLSTEPWIAPFKLLKKDYQKIIFIPRPDFGTRMEIWRRELCPYQSLLHSDVNLSVLSKLSDGWTGGPIKRTVAALLPQPEKVLGEGGVALDSLLKDCKVVRMEDFLVEMTSHEPVFLEQDRAWSSWFNKTPLQKARLAAQAPPLPFLKSTKGAKRGSRGSKAGKKKKKGA